MRTLRRALLASATVSATVGVVFFLLPPAVGDATVAPLAPDAAFAPPALSAGVSSLAEDVVLANAFSVRRAPPASRYTPSDAAVDSSGGMLADPAAPPGPSSDFLSGPRLLGTVVGEGGTQVLLQLDPPSGTPRLYAVGDRDGGYRVIAIAPRSVVLTGPRGRLTLRLESGEERP